MLRSPYIEIIGLAGSGKSTFRDLLIEQGHKSGEIYRYRQPLNVNMLGRFQLVCKVLSFFFVYPITLKWIIASPSGPYSISPHVNAVVKNLKFRVILESIIIKYLLSSNSKPLINDEGIIGKTVVLSLLLQKNMSEVILLLDKLLPSEMSIFLIDIDAEKAIRQMYDRGLSLPFWEQMNGQLRFALCEDCRIRYAEICHVLSQQNGVSTYKISNNGSKKDLAQKIMEDLSA